MTNSEGDVCSPYIFISYYINTVTIFVLFMLSLYIKSLKRDLFYHQNTGEISHCEISHCEIQTDVEPPILVVIDPNNDIRLLN